MKKSLVVVMSALFLLSSCDTYTGMGAYTGTTLGSIFGSAIGGIAGGPRGSDVGTLAGMVGGAIVGAAVGNAADQHAQQQREDDLAQYRQDKAERQAARERRNQQGSYQGYDSNTVSSEQGPVFDPNNGEMTVSITSTVLTTRAITVHSSLRSQCRCSRVWKT